MTHATSIDLQEWFGGIDIYLFDQLLKGRIVRGISVLDAGCGSGRNLVYFLKTGFEVFAVDESDQAIERLRQLAATLAPHLPQENFKSDPVERMRFEDNAFDVVLSSAVLHFARDDQHWIAMVEEMWRVLKTGGIFFARLASTIGIEDQVRLIEGRRYRLPDGSDRFLVDAEMLHRVSNELGGEFLEPIKTTIVENMRAMTTWVLRKRK
ncbi:MAG TPA: class I SAM-dependent methyltransferase [Pyrinomonadaceae bacterium]|nr:class I SAM-dependent methyltransferase [Pyrinomonadaceae bacterium]